MTRALAGAAALLVMLGVAWADWDAAQGKADEFKKKHEELRKLAVTEAKKIVAAACAATDDRRESAASSAASDARSRINDRYNELERLQKETSDLLQHVADDTSSKRRDDARSLKSDIASKWDKLRDATRTLRDGNHPVMDFMARGAKSAKRDHESRCDVREFSLDAGRACLVASGETCKVIAMTADNSSAISHGKDQASRFVSQLENELKKSSSDVLKHLIDAKRDFAKCKRFEVRVDCFKQCPEIDDDLRVRESSPSWREGCW